MSAHILILGPRDTPRNEMCLLYCVAVCCGVSQCVAMCCSVLRCVAVCCSVLQCVTVCYSVLQCAPSRHTLAVRGVSDVG